MGPVLLGVFLFVVIGSALFQILNVGGNTQKDILIWGRGDHVLTVPRLHFLIANLLLYYLIHHKQNWSLNWLLNSFVSIFWINKLGSYLIGEGPYNLS